MFRMATLGLRSRGAAMACTKKRLCRQCFVIGLTLSVQTFCITDDLDLHVITPGGVEIYFDMGMDEGSQGRLDKDDAPEEMARCVENIYFPTDGSAPKGAYQYFVRNFDQIEEVDNWMLSVRLGDDRLRLHTGETLDQLNSTVYTYVHV